MGEIATSVREVILFYNPDSILAEKVLAYAKAEGFPLREVDILKTPFTGTQIEELAERLHVSVENLINKAHPDFRRWYKAPNLSDDDWIKIMKNHPEFIKEPIAIRGDIAILVKTPSDLVKL
ncbi:MAG: ArsC/Spx/MgsR family protein [Gillisia sp.]